MSLIRSASGPAGGLSINTGAANAFFDDDHNADSVAIADSRHLYSGATPNPTTSSGGLFGSGSTTTSTTAPATGTNTMATTGGLFGTGAAKTGGGLFGQSTTGAATTGTTGGGLFGNTAAASNPPATSSLFGSAATNTATTQQQQPATGGGLFGNTAPAQQAAPTGTSLFGQSTQNQQQQQQQQTGPKTDCAIWGQPPQSNQSQAKPSIGLFGQQPQQNQTLGQSTNQVSAVQINYENIRPRTRFDDLAKPVQDEIALLDKGIMRVIKMKDEISEFMPQHERDIDQLGRDVKFVESKFRTVQVALNNDIQTVKALQDLTKKNAADARLCFRGADNLKLPTHYHQTGLFASASPAANSTSGDAASTHADAQDLITYFNRICDDTEKYKKRLDEYRGEIERDMPGVENGLYEQIRSVRDRSAGNAIVQDQLGEVLLALRETGNAIVGQAGQIADTRERLSRLQAGILDSGVYAMGMAA
ncbi:Nucleoporin nup49/NSP49 (Nuclear pore protein nup49/NSP49) [Neonectria punicea]|uniref:Nucleoporin nup49/NSP49 (Nuclear pore protein nup49/NSP49) n=1 Tax=Neonectria punicea TaxID=979145 RepID=A0ABR1GM43_9HYPO